MTKGLSCLAVAVLLAGGCSGLNRHAMNTQRLEAAAPAVAALQNAEFDRAGALAAQVVDKDGDNAQAQLVLALCTYHGVMHQLYRDLTSLVGGMAMGRALNYQLLADALERAERGLAEVADLLAAGSRAENVHLELCLACWERDWNHSGAVDDFDRRLFEVEYDANGEPIPEGDPRRRPTFNFDRGDVFWARAMVSFQRALLLVLAAYRPPDLNELQSEPESLTISLVAPKQMARARTLLLEGIDHADRARREFLAEQDDDREWLPNPRQRNHPLPLPVDEALYDTWAGVLRDLRELIASREGISVAEVAQLGDHQWRQPPGGYIDVGRLLSRPADIVIRRQQVETLDHEPGPVDVERILGELLGDSYRQQMKPTPLLRRLLRMKGEIERGQESLGRKLRYFLWLN